MAGRTDHTRRSAGNYCRRRSSDVTPHDPTAMQARGRRRRSRLRPARSAASQVRRRAAERLIMNADQAAQMLVRMMEDRGAVRGPREDRPRSPRPRGSDRDASPSDHPHDGGPAPAFLRGVFDDPSNWESTFSHVRRQRSRATQPAILITTTPSQTSTSRLRLSSQKVSQPTTRRPESQR